MGREFELKFHATPQQMAAILEDFTGFREITMVSTYYDTPDCSLAPLRWTLRQRMENEVSVCTLKTPCQEGGRCEWEVECADIMGAIDELCKQGAPEELKALVAGGLEPVCSARFTRQATLLELENCSVELAVDKGILKGGFRIQLLGDVEVELKSGSDADVIAFAKTLAAKYGLVTERNSKYLRALNLTGKI